jgi:hypothetical protein
VAPNPVGFEAKKKNRQEKGNCERHINQHNALLTFAQSRTR